MALPKNAGLEQWDADDAIAGRRALVQPMTQLRELGIKASPGQFIDKAAKTVYDDMDVVVFDIKKNRQLSHPYGSKDKGWRCWSDDFIHPSAKVENPLSPTGLCKDCSHAQEDQQYELMCLDIKATKDSGVPVVFIYTAKKSSLGGVRVYVRDLGNKRPLDMMVTMKGHLARAGNFYVVDYGNKRPVTDDVAQDVELAYNLYARPDLPSASPAVGIAETENEL